MKKKLFPITLRVGRWTVVIAYRWWGDPVEGVKHRCLRVDLSKRMTDRGS